MKLRIYIATTDGPSEIQSLVEEDPDISSVVCLNGTTQALPITPGYDAFVRKPTGVIERLTGHRVYRLDVSRPITNGESWQLGVYLAHALHREGRLAQKGEAANGVLFVTGAVNARGLAVEQVGHMAEKLNHTGPLMIETATDGVPLTIFLPKADLDEQIVGNLPANVDVFAIDHVDEALEALQLGATGAETTAETQSGGDVAADPAQEAEPEPEQVVVETSEETGPAEASPRHRERKWGRLMPGLMAVIGLSGAAFGYHLWDSGPRQWQQMVNAGQIDRLEASLNGHGWPWLADYYRDQLRQGPTGEVLELSVRGLRPSDGKSCAGLRFRNTSLKAETIQADGSDQLRLNRPERLCHLEFELTNRSGKNRHIWSSVIPRMAHSRFRDKNEAVQLFTGELESGESIVLPIKLPLFRSDDLRYTLTALTFDQPSEEISERFYQMVEKPDLKGEAFDKYLSYGLTLLRREIPVSH